MNHGSESQHAVLASEICTLIGAALPEGFGGDRVLTGMAPLSVATPFHVAYIQNAKMLAEGSATKAGLVLVPQGLAVDHPGAVPVAHVMGAVVKVLHRFHPAPAPQAFVHPSAVVDPTAQVGEAVYVGANAVVGPGAVLASRCRIDALCYVGARARVGEGSHLHARVSLMDDCEVGKRVEVQSGAVIGGDGFRFELIEGRLTKIPQVGRVVIGDDVEIGANSTIDRAGLTETRIGSRTKIDNLVQIGHNCTIGTDCIIVSQVGIAGSVKIGAGVMMGGGAVVKDHVSIGNRVKIAGRSAVQHDLPDGAEVIGNPAIPLRDYAKFTWFYKNFPALWAKLKKGVDGA